MALIAGAGQAGECEMNMVCSKTHDCEADSILIGWKDNDRTEITIDGAYYTANGVEDPQVAVGYSSSGKSSISLRGPAIRFDGGKGHGTFVAEKTGDRVTLNYFPSARPRSYLEFQVAFQALRTYKGECQGLF